MKVFFYFFVFYSIEVNYVVGKYLFNYMDIIIKFIFCNCSDSDMVFVNGYGGIGIMKNKIKNEY